ncbi:MAG: flagellar M-ring protein FliF [Syntrophorhabdaceae bacterium]|nr:flagellar M-ring protein FliF [Syntrophorhabdaceae bacterium]
MADRANITKVIEVVKEWPMQKKAVALSAIVIFVALLVLVFAWSQKEDYQILFTNLSEEDSGQIVVKLKEMKIPYRAEARGILVPQSRVYDTRLQLASQGLPQSGGVGYELFDKNSFGTTEFVQKLNYKRALQGELARTIMSMSPVEHCRVHLAMPEKSLFVREGEERPTASVLVRLRSGRMLSVPQVEGIVHLVASSIEGLESKDVTVVDTRGNVLSKQPSEYASAGLSAKQFEFQSRYAKELEARIVYILEAAVGKGKVRARVSAEVDMSRVETTEEKFDPDSQVARSEQKQSERSSSSGPGGVPGVVSNLPDKGISALGQAQGSSMKQNQIVNYEISKVVSHTINTPGVIKKVTAAVIVDGAYVAQKGSKKTTYVPRKDEEIKGYESLVKEAIGFTESRGDQVKVVNAQFEPDTDEDDTTMMGSVVAIAGPLMKNITPILIVIMLFLFVVRPIMRSMFGKGAEKDAKKGADATAGVESDAMGDIPGGISGDAPGGTLGGMLGGAPGGVSGGTAGDAISSPGGKITAKAQEKAEELTPKEPSMQEVVAEWARNNPKETANIIKDWMSK